MATAQTPELINYQGRLVESNALVNGTYSFGFTLYTNSTGGKLADGAVDGDALADGAVSGAKLSVTGTPAEGDVLAATAGGGLAWHTPDAGPPLSPVFGVCVFGIGKTRNAQLADHNSQRREAPSKSESFKFQVARSSPSLSYPYSYS